MTDEQIIGPTKVASMKDLTGTSKWDLLTGDNFPNRDDTVRAPCTVEALQIHYYGMYLLLYKLTVLPWVKMTSSFSFSSEYSSFCVALVWWLTLYIRLHLPLDPTISSLENGEYGECSGHLWCLVCVGACLNFGPLFKLRMKVFPTTTSLVIESFLIITESHRFPILDFLFTI